MQRRRHRVGQRHLTQCNVVRLEVVDALEHELTLGVGELEPGQALGMGQIGRRDGAVLFRSRP